MQVLHGLYKVYIILLHINQSRYAKLIYD